MPGSVLPPNGTLKPVGTLSHDCDRSTVMSEPSIVTFAWT
jgi:hypothetical protein